MRVWVGIASFCLASAVMAQTAAPVTVSEADTAMRRAYGHLQSVLRLPAPKFQPSNSKATLSRSAAVQRFFAMYEYIRPRVQSRVKPMDVDAKRITAGLDPQRQQQLRTLISFGLVPMDSPLVTGKPSQFSTREFGTMLGRFLNQAMDITHQQDPRFSPELMP